MSADAVANAEQQELWAREGEQWVREADRYDAMNRRFGEAMLDAAALSPGERVLDVGCGNGITAIEAARRVGADGSVVGADISPPMLALARRRADEAGCGNVAFVEADAQVHPFDAGSFDVVVSRFGNMFFADPVAAFTNLHGALRPGGRLALVCWKELFENEWVLVPGAAAAEFVGLPEVGEPDAPGPFAFADPARLRGILDTAGFGDIAIDAASEPMRLGDDPADVTGWFTSMTWVRDGLLGDKPEDQVRAAVDAITRAFEPHHGPDGVVVQGNAWLVTASA